MRKLYIVERREVITVAAQSEEGAIEEAVAMLVESADESIEPFTVLGSYDEPEAMDIDMAELVGAVKALEGLFEWVGAHEVKAEVGIHIRESIDVATKKLSEML